MTNTKAYALRHRNLATFALIAVLKLAYMPSVVFKYVWLDLQKVEVSNELVVTAYRDIHLDFTGSFTGTVRKADDHTFICTGAPEGRFTYRRQASARNPITFGLWKWVGVEGHEATCTASMHPNVNYYVDTCHKVYGPWGIQLGQRCHRSELFAPTAASLK